MIMSMLYQNIYFHASYHLHQALSSFADVRSGLSQNNFWTGVALGSLVGLCVGVNFGESILRIYRWLELGVSIITAPLGGFLEDSREGAASERDRREMLKREHSTHSNTSAS